DRRRDSREREIELGRLERRLDGGEGGLGDLGIRLELLVLLARRRLLGEQPFRTIAVRARELELRLCAFALGSKSCDLRFERASIDREQQVAARDAAALVEVHRLDEAADPRPDLDVA